MNLKLQIQKLLNEKHKEEKHRIQKYTDPLNKSGSPVAYPRALKFSIHPYTTKDQRNYYSQTFL